MNSSASIPPFPPLVDFRTAMHGALRPPSMVRRALEVLAVAALVGTLFWFEQRDAMLTGLIGAIALTHEGAVWTVAWLLGLKRRSNTWLRIQEAAAPSTDAWREAAVAISGPIAGLAISVAFTIHSLHGSHPVYARYGYVIGLFNGFMLVPVFPLDGGRFFHSLFFARIPSKGVVFRIIAAMGLIGGAVYTHQLWPVFFAMVPLYAFRSSLTLDLLAQTLRLRFSGAVPDDDRIIEELRRAFPRERRPEVIAAKAIRLKALIVRRKPPAAIAAALVGLYGLACAVAVVVLWYPMALG